MGPCEIAAASSPPNNPILALAPRLRRLGAMLIGDQARADAVLLGVLGAAKSIDRAITDADALALALFLRAAYAFEADARVADELRTLSRILPASVRPAAEPDPALGAEAALLGRFRALSFEQRLVAALSIVEGFPIEQAARIARMRTDAFNRTLAATYAALGADQT